MRKGNLQDVNNESLVEVFSTYLSLLYFLSYELKWMPNAPNTIRNGGTPSLAPLWFGTGSTPNTESRNNRGATIFSQVWAAEEHKILLPLLCIGCGWWHKHKEHSSPARHKEKAATHACVRVLGGHKLTCMHFDLAVHVHNMFTWLLL